MVLCFESRRQRPLDDEFSTFDARPRQRQKLRKRNFWLNEQRPNESKHPDGEQLRIDVSTVVVSDAPQQLLNADISNEENQFITQNRGAVNGHRERRDSRLRDGSPMRSSIAPTLGHTLRRRGRSQSLMQEASNTANAITAPPSARHDANQPSDDQNTDPRLGLAQDVYDVVIENVTLRDQLRDTVTRKAALEEDFHARLLERENAIQELRRKLSGLNKDNAKLATNLKETHESNWKLSNKVVLFRDYVNMLPAHLDLHLATHREALKSGAGRDKSLPPTPTRNDSATIKKKDQTQKTDHHQCKTPSGRENRQQHHVQATVKTQSPATPSAPRTAMRQTRSNGANDEPQTPPKPRVLLDVQVGDGVFSTTPSSSRPSEAKLAKYQDVRDALEKQWASQAAKRVRSDGGSGASTGARTSSGAGASGGRTPTMQIATPPETPEKKSDVRVDKGQGRARKSQMSSSISASSSRSDRGSGKKMAGTPDGIQSWIVSGVEAEPEQVVGADTSSPSSKQQSVQRRTLRSSRRSPSIASVRTHRSDSHKSSQYGSTGVPASPVLSSVSDWQS
ncbi:hypothetical protein BD410DRAFT_592317 [Rickenella mellea]|uniref:Uncharacterized protein n=1 Tax=Rickenella mellea TaxID=50990 RepID=A0A4Y7PQJ8_9AGAM|nr:hypothetical protein BD410DRAFT_592317 [Rickenella mellea]